MFVFSCLVLIGWTPSATASKQLFVWQSWKRSSTEKSKWPTTEHTDDRSPGPVAGPSASLLLHGGNPVADSALSPPRLGSEQKHPLCFDQMFLVPDWQWTSALAPNIPGKVQESPSPSSFASISDHRFHLSSFGVTMDHAESRETQWLANEGVILQREERRFHTRWNFWRGSEGSLCVSLRRLAHFREKLQSPRKDFLRNAQIENTLEGHSSKKKKKKMTFFLFKFTKCKTKRNC